MSYPATYAGPSAATLRGNSYIRFRGQGAPAKTADRFWFYDEGQAPRSYGVGASTIINGLRLAQVTGLGYAEANNGAHHWNVGYTDGTKQVPDSSYAGRLRLGGCGNTGWEFAPGVAAVWATQGQPEPKTQLAITTLLSGPGIGLTVTDSSQDYRSGQLNGFVPAFQPERCRQDARRHPVRGAARHGERRKHHARLHGRDGEPGSKRAVPWLDAVEHCAPCSGLPHRCRYGLQRGAHRRAGRAKRGRHARRGQALARQGRGVQPGLLRHLRGKQRQLADWLRAGPVAGHVGVPAPGWAGVGPDPFPYPERQAGGAKHGAAASVRGSHQRHRHHPDQRPAVSVLVEQPARGLWLVRHEHEPQPAAGHSSLRPTRRVCRYRGWSSCRCSTGWWCSPSSCRGDRRL